MKKFVLTATVILSFVCILLIFGKEISPFKHESNETSDFGCGDQKMITRELVGKEKKHIFLVENLVKATPHLGCRMWNTYDIVAKIALDIYSSDNPKYQPVIHYFNEQAPELDSLRPAKIVDVSSDSPALAVVGFAWSSMAGTASFEANSIKMPYISPTGVIKSINEGDYSISLGMPLSGLKNSFSFLSDQLGNPNILIVTNTSQVQEREFDSFLKENWREAVTSIEYQGEFPEAKVMNFLNENTTKKYIVVVPGYATLKQSVEAILLRFPQIPFLVGPQWSHDHKLLELRGEVYCISDYYNFIENDLHDLVTKKWHEHGGGEIIGGYLYSLFDAVFFALKSLDDCNTREQVRSKMKNYGNFTGTKGTALIKEGFINKQVYVLKYEYKQGFKLIKKIKP